MTISPARCGMPETAGDGKLVGIAGAPPFGQALLLTTVSDPPCRRARTRAYYAQNSHQGVSMWRRQLDARGRLLLWAAFLACFGFVLAVVLNLVRFEPATYELASPTSRPHQPSR
jgi:hypothetical protein